MASFVVFQDQENIGVKNGNEKLKEQKSLGRRPVLGIVNSNIHEEYNKTSHEVFIKRNGGEKLLKDGKVDDKINSMFKVYRDKNSKAEEKHVVQSTRTVLKEIHVEPMSEGSVKNDSPMLIDKSPQISSKIPSDIKAQIDDLHDCFVYKDDIYKYLRKLENVHKPKPYYMRRQPDVTYSMRLILVDWLVEVGEEYKLHNETLFMAVSYIDRFLSCMAVVRAKLQLLGTSAMFIASKFEEIYPPDVSEFTYITDDTYTKKQVLRMEHLILKVLSFDLSCPTSYTFVLHISVSAGLPKTVLFLSMYICELTLLEADPYLEFTASIIASGAIALARHCLGYIDVWPVLLANTTGYALTQLSVIINHLNNTHLKSFSSSHSAIRDKYKTTKYLHVAEITHKKLVIRDSGLQA